jgi:hypothetical protein
MQVFTFNPHLIHLFVTTFLPLFLKVLNLQGKDASKSACNWFQFMMVLLTNEYLPVSVLCFVILVFRVINVVTAGTTYTTDSDMQRV